MNDTTRGTAEMTAAMFISGTIGWFVVKSGLPIPQVVFYRSLFGALTLTVICLVMGLFKPGAITWRQAGLAALGGLALVSNWLLLFEAYPRASISIATAVYNTQPFMLVGLSAVFFREKVAPAKLTWLVAAFAGVLLIVQAKSGPSGGDYLTGVLLSASAAFLYAVAALVAKRLKGVPPHLIVLIQVIIGIVVFLPFARFDALMTGESWAMVLSLGGIHTGVMFILLYSALQKLPTTLVGSLSFIYPVVAIAVDHIAFGHRLDVAQWLGAGIILLSAAGMTLGWTWPRRVPAE
ncbi:hypothetical protein ABI_40840 [Asticcacaulis biprosthecium C19]|uniref:EamA domain-containing protein n=1 Tax=Asticcacaulis biprosthecium C19 TaxID=715226 RepID=F4QSE1_9CAUL|nr:DMT family transporter [Asticcacaulis biprosthecium]EGF89661.1 hypothetical protein ABI_40840 [Asticcacaulis biprosthecium C19]